MMTVVILPNNRNGKSFRAVSGEKESFGATFGEAIDAITGELKLEEAHAVFYVQDFRPDEFFTEAQQTRLTELMQKWRDARDTGASLSVKEQTELENLIETELKGSANRAERMAEQLGK